MKENETKEITCTECSVIYEIKCKSEQNDCFNDKGEDIPATELKYCPFCGADYPETV